MSDLLNQLFGLSSFGFGAEGVELGWARPIPAWGWLLAIASAAALAWWSYWRLDGAKAWRIALAALRGGVLLLLLVLISGPELVRPNDRVEKDWVLVLVDRSASMRIADAGAAGAGRELITRDEQVRAAIASAWPQLSQAMQDRTVVWLGFDSGIFDLRADPTAAQGQPGMDLGNPDGRRTSLGAAIDQALSRAAARPISGIVVLSDGRSVDEVSRQALRRLQAEHIPVLALPLGSAEPVVDLALDRAEAPAIAFINDTIPVAVEIDRLGDSGRPIPGRVQLIDKATSQVLAERPLPIDEQAWLNQRTRITLTLQQREAGTFNWIVRVVPNTPDLIAENNQAELAVEIVDRPLRVVYFDGYPRWERHFITNLLLREPSIESSSLMLASNRRYTQEGDVLIEVLPRSPEEWAKFDVIILGDVSPTVFSHDQLEQIRDLVATRGAGLLWVGGPGSTPAAWRETPLAELLPFSLAPNPSAASGGVRPWNEPVVMFPRPAAQRLNLLELGDTPEDGWPARLSDPRTGWSQLHFAQRIALESLKPTAEILASFVPSSEVGRAGIGISEPAFSLETSIGHTPAVLSMRYGAGRVMYVATDEIWRWRYARGEVLPERFWLPLIRLQGRESLARGSRPATLEVAPRRALVEQPVRIAVTLLDQALADAAPGSLTVRLRSPEGDPRGIELALAPEPDQATGRTRSARSYATTWVPTEPGRHRVEVADALLAGSGLSGELEVLLPDDELRRPETDHPLLTRLAEQTGGQVLPVSRLGEVPNLLPRREVHIAGTPDVETLWDKPIMLILLLTLLTAEWVGRRLIRLP
jgi:hypothetical protein